MAPKLILALLLVVFQVGAATKYVDLAATGANNGTSWTDAWQSVTNMTGVSAGDTVYIAKGTYVDRLTVPASGTAGNPVTIAVAQDAPHNGKVYLPHPTGISASKHYFTINGALDQSYPTNNIFNNNLWSITNNIGIYITSTNASGITSSDGVGARILWCDIGPCGSTNQAGNENGIFFNGTDPGPVEIGYCYLHDNVYGDTINIGQNNTAPMNDIVIHHCIMRNTGDDFIQSNGGLTICWCSMRERTASYSSGHTDIMQLWGGGSKLSDGHPDPSWGNVMFHHNEVGDTTGGSPHYGSWSLTQFSGRFGTNFFVYDNLFCDHHETNTSSSAGWGWSSDGFYDYYNAGLTLSNFVIANNLFNGPAHQAMVAGQPQGTPSGTGTEDPTDDWRYGSGEANTGGRGFIAGWAATNFGVFNNIIVDCYTAQAQTNSPAFVFPYTNANTFNYPAGTNLYYGTVYGPTSVIAQATYNPSSLKFDYNVLAGTNKHIQFMSSTAWANVEAMDAALGSVGNSSSMPNFVGYAPGSTWNFALSPSDTVAQGKGTNLTSLMSSLPDYNLDINGNPRPSSAAWDIGPYQTVVDTNLIVWFTFEDNFTNAGYITDQTGNGHNALRYGYEQRGTNFPVQITGTNGMASEYKYYFDGFGVDGKSGDYAAITNLGPLLNLTQATFAVWGRFYSSVSNVIGNDHNATFLDSGTPGGIGTWKFGRDYSSGYGNVKFYIVTNNAAGRWFVNYDGSQDDGWPENYVFGIANNKGNSTNDGSSGWHHYAVTVDCSSGYAAVKAYFYGTNWWSRTTDTPVPYLTVHTPTSGPLTNRFPWIAMGCWTHNGTAMMEDLEGASSYYPNNGWLNGAMDDVRIYNRVLSAAEVLSLYNGTTPVGGTSASSTTIGAGSTIHIGSGAKVYFQ